MKYRNFIAGSLSLVLISSTTLITSNVFSKSSIPEKNTKPLHRGDNYQEFKIYTYLQKDYNFPSVIENQYVQGKILRTFNNDKIKIYFKDNMSQIFEKINLFKKNAKEYLITLNYKITDNKKVLLMDIVWGLPNTNYFYYDQFKINIL